MKIDWAYFADELRKIELVAGKIRFLSTADFERMKLSKLTHGHIEESSFAEQLAYGYSFFEHPKTGPLWRDQWYFVCRAMGAPFEDEDPAPPFIKIDHTCHLEVVRQAVQAQQLSQEFIRSWGLLNRAVSMYGALTMRYSESEQFLKADLKGFFEDNLVVQMHWYAHWIKANAPTLVVKDRRGAEEKLEQLCSDIIEGTVRPWGRYPREWYETLLVRTIPQTQFKGKDPDPEWSLRNNIRRLSKRKLEKMLEHRLLTPNVLPPLKSTLFELATP
jgi:hypothetical protein